MQGWVDTVASYQVNVKLLLAAGIPSNNRRKNTLNTHGCKRDKTRGKKLALLGVWRKVCGAVQCRFPKRKVWAVTFFFFFFFFFGAKGEQQTEGRRQKKKKSAERRTKNKGMMSGGGGSWLFWNEILWGNSVCSLANVCSKSWDSIWCQLLKGAQEVETIMKKKVVV